ncbi:60S ribosomal protein L6 [Chamberlinius hualienensis]
MADSKKSTEKSAAKVAAKKPVKSNAKPAKAGQPRNYKLATGVYRFSRTRMIKKKSLFLNKGKQWKKVEKKASKSKRPRFVTKPIGGEKNGEKRKILLRKMPKYYPTASRPRKPTTRKNFFCQHKRNLRPTITPGTVLIVVAGRQRGKRVVFLKQLKSGLLLVTGPFKLNSCPMRRINQIYVIATKTKLDISKVELPAGISDGYFRRRHPKRKRKDEGELFENKKEEYKPSERRKQDQITIDKQVLDIIRQHPEKKAILKYLASRFCLRNKMYPHKLQF